MGIVVKVFSFIQETLRINVMCHKFQISHGFPQRNLILMVQGVKSLRNQCW